MTNHKQYNPKCDKPKKTKPLLNFTSLVLILSLLLLTPFILYQIKPAKSETRTVPDPYPTIQAAINSAQAQDTIQINPVKIYYENVIVNKTGLTIRGDPSNPQTTIVDGNATGAVFELNASNIHITGLTIRNGGNANSAITSEHEPTGVKSDYQIIENNIITTSQYGVYFSYSDYNKIYNNTFINNPFHGIYLNSADNTNITGNTITDSAYGIQGISSLNTKIINNTITHTTYGIHVSQTSTGNTIRNNKITGQTIAIFSSSDSTTVDHNTVTGSAYGIYFQNNKFSSITYNTLKSNSFGIRLYWSPTTSSQHTISNNLLQGNDWALLVQYANSNTFTGNWIRENTYGAYLEFCSSNVFTKNNFVNNSLQVAPGTGLNTWNQSGLGNHWNNHTTPDADGDGIVDTPYRISPGSDYRPLKFTWSEHDIAVQNVTTSTSQVNPGAPVNITVTLKNKANMSVQETFSVTAYYSSTPIGTITVTPEYIYRDVDSSGKASVGDVRLTPVGSYSAGSTVTSGNTDIGQSLVAFASNEKHCENVAVNTLYDPREYIYRDVGGIGTVSIGDVRLTSVGSYLAGSIVASGNTDIGQSLIAFKTNEKHCENVATNSAYDAGLSQGTTKTLTFTWNTAGVPSGTYPIRAEASVVPDELYPDNNNLTDGNVKIEMPLVGDINSDGTINQQDLTLLMQEYGLTPDSPTWNPNADLNKDNVVDEKDLYILGQNYGMHI